MSSSGLSGVGRELRDFAMKFPEATEDFPWGERAIKVRRKTFLFLRADKRVSFSTKLPKSRRQALVLPFATPTHYGLGKHGWVTFDLPPRVSRALRDQCKEWIRESYLAIAPAKLAVMVSEP